jgi:hypothetical protein
MEEQSTLPSTSTSIISAHLSSPSNINYPTSITDQPRKPTEKHTIVHCHCTAQHPAEVLCISPRACMHIAHIQLPSYSSYVTHALTHVRTHVRTGQFLHPPIHPPTHPIHPSSHRKMQNPPGRRLRRGSAGAARLRGSGAAALPAVKFLLVDE